MLPIAAFFAAVLSVGAVCPNSQPTCLKVLGHGLCENGRCNEVCMGSHGACDSSCEAAQQPNKQDCVCHIPSTSGQCWGDPHCQSFDGLWNHYQGLCEHTLVKLCSPRKNIPDFEVSQNNRPWPRRPGSGLAVVDYLTLRVPGWRATIVIRSNSVTLNGRSLDVGRHTMGKSNSGHFIDVSALRGTRKVQTSFGVNLSVRSGHSQVDLANDNAFRGNTCGLLGNFDGNKNNDLTGRDGTLYPNTWWAWDFGNSWCRNNKEKISKKAQQKAEKEIKGIRMACSKGTGRKKRAEQLCAPLRSLSRCKRAAQFDDCVNDVCAVVSAKDQREAACTAVEASNQACRTSAACA